MINSRRVLDQALAYFSNMHKLDHIGSFCFSAPGSGDVLDDAVSDIVRLVSY